MEICQNCGKKYLTVWQAPDWLWEKVMGRESGLLCMNCFDEKAREEGFGLYWQCEVGEYPNTKPRARLAQAEAEIKELKYALGNMMQTLKNKTIKLTLERDAVREEVKHEKSGKMFARSVRKGEHDA